MKTQWLPFLFLFAASNAIGCGPADPCPAKGYLTGRGQWQPPITETNYTASGTVDLTEADGTAVHVENSELTTFVTEYGQQLFVQLSVPPGNWHPVVFLALNEDSSKGIGEATYCPHEEDAMALNSDFQQVDGQELPATWTVGCKNPSGQSETPTKLTLKGTLTVLDPSRNSYHATFDVIDGPLVMHLAISNTTTTTAGSCKYPSDNW